MSYLVSKAALRLDPPASASQELLSATTTLSVFQIIANPLLEALLNLDWFLSNCINFMWKLIVTCKQNQ